MLHVKGIELSLCLLEGNLHFGHLQYLSRMIGAYTQRLSTVNDIFSKS